MKKGVIIFSLLAVCALNTYSVNIGGMIKDKIGNTVNGAVNDTVNDAVSKQLYSLSKVKVNISSDGKSAEVTGILKNNGPKVNFASISYPCYDKNGSKVGDTIAIVNEGLASKENWNFSSSMSVSSKTQKIEKCDINKAKVSGF